MAGPGAPSVGLGVAEGIAANMTQGGNVLLSLPSRALLLVCQGLRGADLVRLGLVCRGLRDLARRPLAWEHVCWSERSDHPRVVLRVAPALRKVTVSGMAPTLQLLLRGTSRVRDFNQDHEQDGYADGGDEISVGEVLRVLEHYKGHLEVVRMGTLWDEQTLATIDGLGIKELYVGSRLAKTYPGSSKVVKELSFWNESSGEVARHLVSAAHSTLESFHIGSFRLYKNRVACSPQVAMELLRCSALRSASIPTWKASMLSAFPKMNKLCLYEFGDVDHAAAKRTLKAAEGRRNRRQLETLTLCLGRLGHRGLVREVAAGCPAVRSLCLRYQAIGDGSFEHNYQVDVARDLHAVLAPLTQLHTLTLEAARVPSSVFRGLERGALPSLQVLGLKHCGVTPIGRDALASLKAHRAGLAVTGNPPKAACLERVSSGGGFGFLRGSPRETRCSKGVCADASDCEDDDDDPVPDDEEDFEPFSQQGQGEGFFQLLDRLGTRYVDPMMEELMNADGSCDEYDDDDDDDDDINIILVDDDDD